MRSQVRSAVWLGTFASLLGALALGGAAPAQAQAALRTS
jgi:hypothetical protein